MLVYILSCVVLGVLSIVLFSLKARKLNEPVYNDLDKAGKITNIVLTVVYVVASPLYLFLGFISYPACEGFLVVIGWIVSILNASSALFCGLGIGLSVYFRKKGKSRFSFVIQFLGLMAIAFTVISYCVFAGNLLQTLN